MAKKAAAKKAKKPAARKAAAISSKARKPARRKAAKPAEKIFYKIGEVCGMTDTEPYVLRYWESEFPNLAPSKNRSGQRIYTQEDVDMVLRIKELLYDEGYTIAGARRKLEEEAAQGAAKPAAARAADEQGEIEDLKGTVRKLRTDLRELLDMLS
jgi:DNA-binding transcriptional MerR regulator